ncbi:RHS domain-containing protein [Pseudomonas xanthosomatis]|uniref:RHS repeat-associated core domain-containing protein n=1 Tax=Pseudomonas xanthosomatis TaxID=2842356 RepID=UPI001C3E78BB|nr:RHS repeat-associated core domain-containing protein [Pseudomonas xanthosomatis]QXH48218.1 RHS domain-containing protein [Pseudomonas xanthosomatis]
MDDSLHAARQGDLILHPPLMAELVSTLTEAVVYAAATAAVAAAIGGAVVAVVGTGGAAAVLTPLIAGALVGAAAMLPGGEDKSIGDQISDFSSWVGNSMFPPEPYGAIETGSVNTHINGIPAARAAGVVTGVSEPEGPAEEPSILENIGSYAMIGASMMLPIIGLAQEINSIFNPPVTTPADPGTQPAELDTVKCSKHPTPNFVAQGSDKVFINGHPAARVGDKSTCDGPIGMTFSPNVRIGGGTVTVRDIHDGKSAAAKIIGIVAGMLLSRRGGKARPRPGKSPRPRSRIPRCKGRPVMVSSGAKLLDGIEDHDFNLPGLLPIEWARRYDSNDSRDDGMFGRGWSLVYEVRIERVAHPQGGELWVYVDEEGSRIELGQLQEGSAFVSSLDGLAFFHQAHGITVVECIYSGQYQVFKTDPHDPRRSRLVQLGDRNLNRLDLLYDAEGRLQYLADTFASTAIQMCYSEAHRRRVSEVRRLYLRPGSQFEVQKHETLVSYRHTADGQLSEVLEPGGQIMRRFCYTEQGLMASHMLPTGAVFHYQWQRFDACLRQPAGLPALLEPQPDHEWRVVRHWSEDGEEYSFTYDLQRGHTDITDGLGRSEHYEWGPMHEITLYIDPLGQRWQESIEQGRLVATTDPQGNQWRYSYDALGRLTGIQDPLGRSERIEYTEHWALPMRITTGAGQQQRFDYDRQGNLLRTTDALGRSTQYAYDQQGRLRQLRDTLGKTRDFEWNAQGRLTAMRDCSGHSTAYSHDPRGYLSAIRDARGAITRYQFDARGRLEQSLRPDGRTDHYRFDAAGQLISHTGPAQQVTQWSYDSRGRLIQRTDAMGLTQRTSWDCYDRLVQLENENGEHYRLAWDELDRPRSQRNLDGGGRDYHYDVAGNLVQIDLLPHPGLQAQPQTQRFEHDAVGRVLRKHTADGTTDYRYDAADNLLSISCSDVQGSQQHLHFSYDALGQLLSETSDAGQLRYSHDEQGNLQTLTLPDGRCLNHLYYGSGHLHQMNLDGRVICDFERDELHAEVLRSQGKLDTRRSYDSCARLVQKAIRYHDASAATLALLQKDYHYDAADDLVREVLTQTHRRGGIPTDDSEAIIGRMRSAAHGQGSFQGQVSYVYGPTERLHGAIHQRPGAEGQRVEQYAYDRAGNPLDGASMGGHVQHDRVTRYKGLHYRYDAFGRLLEKRTANRLVQHFEYDAEHRLRRICQQRGAVRERIEFSYDPLGRRTRKQLYRNDHPTPVSQTEFFWQGLRLLYEQQDGKPSLYVYTDPNSHEPLARIDGRAGKESFFYFHTNLAGLPEQVTDEQGNAVWHSEHEVWGNSRDEWHNPHTDRQQNLRFQGQYLDRETGLHYNILRFYDPDIGRFTQADPIGLLGGLNLYRYSPNPIIWIDPLGLHTNSVVFTDSRGLTLEARGYIDLDHLTESQLKSTIFMNGPDAPTPFGKSPVDQKGERIDLHHHRQQSEGPITGMPQKHHGSKEHNAGQHPKGKQKGAGINNRQEFNLWKKEFWVSQAQKALDRKQSKASNGACEL